jgi:hypothetical protein
LTSAIPATKAAQKMEQAILMPDADEYISAHTNQFPTFFP